MKIKIIDSILCQADRELIPHVAPCLEFQKTFWRNGQFKKEQKTYTASFIHSRSGIFLSGLLPRVKKFLFDKKISFKMFGKFERIAFENSPILSGITFRIDQEQLIEAAYKKQRGVILSPTGSGKTIIALGFLSMFPKLKILFLCNSLSIISQTAKEMKRFSFDDILVLGGGKKDWESARIIVSTIQTFVKFPPKLYCDYFDVVIVDEAHNSVDRKGQYGQVLQSLLSPVKLGFTATLPVGKEKQLSLEGLIGPVIGEITMQKGINLGIIAKPEIKLVTFSKKKTISSYKYADIYRESIVENRVRNKLIAKIAKEIVEKNETVLIMVKEIVHGENIQALAMDLYNIEIKFVQGSTDLIVKDRLKCLLDEQKIKAVISTSVWKEGVNIRSLNNIIIAMGGKSHVLLLQSLGRGLRRTESKTSVMIYDFVDVAKYLSEHFVERLQIYLENNWKITNYKS